MSTTVYTYNDKVLVNSANDKWLKKYIDPYNPLGLPPHTMRVKMVSLCTPPSHVFTTTLVDETNNIWDLYYDSNDWNGVCSDWYSDRSIEAVLGANTTGITDMGNMFDGSTLTSTVLFDTRSVTNMSNMFASCPITSIPLYDTSSVVYMNYTFNGCVNVTGGALALYQQASGQTTPPEEYEGCFTDCGSNTQTGAAELAQIPSSWGGTAS